MSKKVAIARYSIIINKLRKQRASFDEILDTLKVESDLQAYDFTISKRTFQRDISDIRTIYGIEIANDKRNKLYYIEEEESAPINERILEAYDTFNALSIGDRVAEHITFENRSTLGTQHLFGILHAIENKTQLSFTYKSYYYKKAKTKHVEAYSLKEYKGRWYLISVDCSDKCIKSFSLDRMSDLDITNRSFEMEEPQNINSYYEDSFGIVGPNLDSEPEEVFLEFSSHQANYIKSLPLHHSQQIIVEEADFTQFKLKVHITHDFIMELLSHGKELRVISPSSLVDQIKETLILSLEQYK